MTPFPRSLHSPATFAAIAALLLSACPALLCAQQTEAAGTARNIITPLPQPEPAVEALPLPEDRGAADLEQTLKRLGTTASVLIIVAHPDDEDGALMAYLSRGLGVRVTALTLTRGEGGLNAMGDESYDALGLIRTNELLKADEYYGAQALWGTEADYGFSKTQEEAFSKWGHDRVLYDAVLAVRMVRPQIIMSTFVGGPTDGHGHHQVAGEVAQEAFKVAGDSSVFPEQLRNGLQPWQPLAVYSREPFARIENGQMFDYATGKSAPARFHNYVTGEWTEGAPKADVTIPVGTWDPVLGRTYVQIAREGWGRQLSQNGGANPALSAPDSSSYHLWAVAPSAAGVNTNAGNASLFQNQKVNIDTSIAGLARLAGPAPPAWLSDGLRKIQSDYDGFMADCSNRGGVEGAHKLVPVYHELTGLYVQVSKSNLPAEARASLEFELGEKIDQMQTALKDLLGLNLIAYVTGDGGQGGPGRGASADEASRSVYPGEAFHVRVHAAQATGASRLGGIMLVSHTGTDWRTEEAGAPPGALTAPIDAATAVAPAIDRTFRVEVPEDAKPTEPYFTRPTTEQPYYDISNPSLRLQSFAPYPLTVMADFTFDGVPIVLSQVVQTLARVPGVGGVYQPLVVTPAVGVRVEPEARLLPPDGSPLPVRVTIHAEKAADGMLNLKLPEGWHCEPTEQKFHLSHAGDADPLVFSVTPAGDVAARAYTIQAVAHVGEYTYSTGWQSIGYPGLRPYNQYQPAELRTRKVDVKLAPGLRVGYVMGTGDTVPEAIEALGVTPHLLTDGELATADLSAWNVIVVGTRAYSVRPVLAAAESRLESFIERGGTLLVLYQTSNFPAPLPLVLRGIGERVVDEQDPVKLLDPANPLFTTPNRITSADFDGWFEERGHGFLDHWDPGYTALTETADPGQDPQRGGLLVAHRGKGTYIYVAFALHRQFPELVPGAYRLFANLLSAGASSASAAPASQPSHQ
jgi:LmbE family N-acetylglucosaminyl deacetylase